MPDLYQGENANTRVPATPGQPPRPATEPPGAKSSSQTDHIDAGSGEQPPSEADPSRQPS